MNQKSLPLLSAVIHREKLSDGLPVWVAYCPELEVTTQGYSVENAHAMLREAVECLLEEADTAKISRRLNAGGHVVALDMAA